MWWVARCARIVDMHAGCVQAMTHEAEELFLLWFDAQLDRIWVPAEKGSWIEDPEDWDLDQMVSFEWRGWEKWRAEIGLKK